MALKDHEMKRCTSCNQIKPRSSEYFHPQGPGKPLRAVCKECVNKGKRERASNSYERDFRGSRRPKPCTVIVAENAEGKRRALRWWEWENVPDGWQVIGVGSHLLEFMD